MKKQKLISVSDYAKQYGITKNAVFNRIRSGKLESVKEKGVRFVVVTEGGNDTSNDVTPQGVTGYPPPLPPEENDKNTQIELVSVLKESIETLKDQLTLSEKKYMDLKDTIELLERKNDQVIRSLESKVQLLERKYHEDVRQIRDKIREEDVSVVPFEETMEMSDFVELLRKRGKKLQEIKHLLVTALIDGDDRFYFDGKSLHIKKSDFVDFGA